MNTKSNWNTQSKTDTVAFSALIATAMLLSWFAAATPIADPNKALSAAPAMTQTVVPPADLANGSRIVVTASRLAKKYG